MNEKQYGNFNLEAHKLSIINLCVGILLFRST